MAGIPIFIVGTVQGSVPMQQADWDADCNVRILYSAITSQFTQLLIFNSQIFSHAVSYVINLGGSGKLTTTTNQTKHE